MSHQSHSFSKSPFRREPKIGDNNLKAQFGATMNAQKRDRSEVTQTSVGPPPQTSGQKNSAEKMGSGHKNGSVNSRASNPLKTRLVNLSPTKLRQLNN